MRVRLWVGLQPCLQKPSALKDIGKENGNYYSILGLYRDNAKENGNYCSILGLYRENGKENGIYYSILGLYKG